jgi:hypothetical protein
MIIWCDLENTEIIITYLTLNVTVLYNTKIYQQQLILI